MNNVMRLCALFLLITLSACGKGHGDNAAKVVSPMPSVAIYLSGAEIQAETPEQRQLLHEALNDMLSRSGEDMRQVRYGPKQIPLREILRAHLVPVTPVAVTDDDFYNQASDERVRKAVQSLNTQLVTAQ